MITTNQSSLAAVDEIRGVRDGYLKQHLFDGRSKRKLGDVVGITQFGVNHTTLEPGAFSALRHWHQGEDEFIFVLNGELSLIDENGAHKLEPGCFCGFPAGSQNAHHIENTGNQPASFIEVGSRRPGQDTVHYPDDDFGPINR